MKRRFLPMLALLPLLAGCETFNRDPAAEPARIVFFNDDSDTLDPAARAIVQGAADAAKRFSNVRVNVFGYAGPAGGAALTARSPPRVPPMCPSCCASSASRPSASS